MTDKPHDIATSRRDEILLEISRKGRVWNNGNFEDSPIGLIELCRKWIVPGAKAAEVGCFAGVSTSIIACFAESVIAVDPWTLLSFSQYSAMTGKQLEWAESNFRDKVCPMFPNITMVKDFSISAAKGVADHSLDFVYLDGDHSEKHFIADVLAWRPKLKPGGILAGHDLHLVGGYFAAAGLPSPVEKYPESSWVVVS